MFSLLKLLHAAKVIHHIISVPVRNVFDVHDSCFQVLKRLNKHTILAAVIVLDEVEEPTKEMAPWNPGLRKSTASVL